VDEIGLHERDDFAGRASAASADEGLWFAAKRDDETSAGAANFSGEAEQFLFE